MLRDKEVVGVFVRLRRFMDGDMSSRNQGILQSKKYIISLQPPTILW
jgi:hypothetical protein